MLEFREYPSDLSNEQWELIKDLIPPARAGGRPRTRDVRQLLNAVFYIVRSGCAWRYLPKSFPPWQTVYDYFSQWRQQGIWREIHLRLAKCARTSAGKAPTPSTVIIDSQSIRAHYGEMRGWDGFKKVRGRKRQILVDTFGILWGVGIHAANSGDCRKGYLATQAYPPNETIPKRILGDNEYGKGPFDLWVNHHWGIWPQSKKSSKTESNLRPTRWIVERSFAWFNHFRRLSRDYERKINTSVTMLYISQARMLLNRLRN